MLLNLPVINQTDVTQSFIIINTTYEEQQKCVVDEVIKISSGYIDNIQVLNNLIAELGIYVSLAQTAIGSPWKNANARRNIINHMHNNSNNLAPSQAAINVGKCHC